VALNQVRRVVKSLMERHRPPDEIIVETARDLPFSAKRKSDLEKIQRENKEANDERRKELERLGQADTGLSKEKTNMAVPWWCTENLWSP
jgi:CRISPR-associated endonuclease Csn1